MTELIQKKLSDSTGARWTALLIVAFTMMMGYFITDVMSPLEVLLETPKAQGGLGWTAGDYGIFAGSYGFISSLAELSSIRWASASLASWLAASWLLGC